MGAVLDGWTTPHSKCLPLSVVPSRLRSGEIKPNGVVWGNKAGCDGVNNFSFIQSLQDPNYLVQLSWPVHLGNILARLLPHLW